MCGIFGFAGFGEPGVLARMGDVIRHRGPDDDGFFEEDVHLGMRRLSIIDIAGGRQPVGNEDGSVVVICNGEIYNYLELRAGLEAQGHRFHTDSDTEVVVHAYEAYGHDCLRHFHGMFAFALYDRRSGELFVARDRVGMKPLYYWHAGGELVFASEIKAILQSAHVPRRCDPAMLDSYLALRYVPNPASLFEGIHVLPAAHCLTWRAGRLTLRRWWDVDLGTGPYAPDADYLDAFDATFTASLRRHLRSDVPVGAYLSGGSTPAPSSPSWRASWGASRRSRSGSTPRATRRTRPAPWRGGWAASTPRSRACRSTSACCPGWCGTSSGPSATR